MFDLIEIFAYAVVIGFEFAALCAMTRGGRGLSWRILGLLALAGVGVLMEVVLGSLQMPYELWLAVFFALGGCVMSALIVGFSRDSFGRRLFLASVYGAYAACYASLFNLIAYRNVDELGHNILGLSYEGGVWCAIAVVAALNLVFFRWILPQLPRDDHDFRWNSSCLVAGVMFVLLVACGIWPISLVTAPARFCAPFVLLAAAAWVGFPLLCRSMRDYARKTAVERHLALMMNEVAVRRAAIDEARRIRHDQRHHRAQIAEYLLLGQPDKALAYLGELDEAAKASAADRLIWCENETVNAILSGCARKAAAKGIGFSAEADVRRTLGLPEVETVAVLANLIENAINAAVKARVEGRESPTVTVTLRQREHGVGIRVTNPVPEGFALSAKGLPCSEPGIGMASVLRVLERHRGEWAYEQLSGGILSCRIALLTDGSEVGEIR